ncbi:MAG: SDR family NAD(P)-dependent oxidoreductase [Nitrosopumilales archaeon]|nr:SDR family NAD(P)-dependent oxidoreductase [Nitrosopumilales archaeon]
MKAQSFRPSLKFNGKIVVITGSGTGIGQAIAKKFAENGAHIVIMGRRREPLELTSAILSDTVKAAGSTGKVRSFHGVDVADEVGINNMFKVIKEEFGTVDIIINNAGVSGPVKVFTSATHAEFKECVAIHLTGAFWTSLQGIKSMERGGKIITIATFFTEENRYEQRPYRFRAPYTSAQGSKNRLAEALAWELVEKGIKSIATNPGPVHSDRIYKTVYPKAAAEFLRIGGYQGLTSIEIERVLTILLQLLGQPEPIVSEGIREAANEISKSQKSNSTDSFSSVAKMEAVLSGLLAKVQEIAEKIQFNTAKMIVDGEFLTQDDVANMVLNLCDDVISKLINGRVVPNDRVFYPVKPLVGTAILGTNLLHPKIKDKVVVITITSSSEKDLDRANKIAAALSSSNVKQVVILAKNPADLTRFRGFHSHLVNLSEEKSVRMIFETVRSKFGSLDALIHLTGDYDYDLPFSSLARAQWDSLVDNFINIPGLIVKEAVNMMAPEGAADEPVKFRGSKGVVVIIGPDAPVGKKISGTVRARSEVFRGALRPYTATVNQELADVLGSDIRLYLVLPGNIEGEPPDTEMLKNSLTHLLSVSSLKRSEVIFYIDESKS